MRVKVQTENNGLTLTPVKKHGRPRFVGTAIISNVVIRSGVCTGDLVGEYLETFTLAESEIPNSVKSRMRPLSETVESAKVVYATPQEILYFA